MELLRKTVSHRRYGSGTITAMHGDVMTVFFDQYGAHSFRFPEIFREELKLSDDAAQRHVQELLEETEQE